MKNKFLEYLVNDRLKDITYALREIDTEKNKRYSQSFEDYPYIDDFFEFMFEVNVSQEELFTGIRKERATYSLADMLFGYETQNDKKRKEKIDMFRPLLENNINFYKQIIKVALSEHQYIREEFKKYNEEIFSDIINVGIQKSFFQYFSETEKQTQIPQYKKILIEKGIFNSQYNVDETIKILGDKNEKKAINHFSMYSTDIHKVLEGLNEENYDKLMSLVMNILKIEEENKDIELSRRFNQFISYLIEVEKEEFIPLIHNQYIKNSIIYSDLYSNKALSSIVKQPQLLERFILQCSDEEKRKLFKLEKYSAGSVIQHFTETSRDSIYIDASLLMLVLENIDKHITENQDQENTKHTALSHILFHQANKQSDKTIVNKLFEKYTKNIVKALSNYEDNQHYFKYQERIVKFKNAQSWLDSNIWEKINVKIEIAEKDMLYKFSQKIKLGRFEYQDTKYVEHLSNYINLTEDVSVLNVLNVDTKTPEWKDIAFDFTISKKMYNNENIVIYLLRKAGNDTIKIKLVSWLIEDSINNFYDLKFVNKDILSYYQKKDNPLFIKIVDKILENNNSFEILLKNNKVKLKLVNTIENEDIKKKLSYHTLRQKLSDNSTVEQEKIKIKNKI